jgi:hypothetical protein
MTDFDWCVLGEPPKDEADIWHMVVPQSATTVCGVPVANPDEEWRWADRLGNHRPCDNCTEILAHRADVLAVAINAPAVTSA